ncbi:MAG TPA: NAD(P)H-hydrate epimerase, partial [Longimicrobiales bacterium]|nr:NAD(P)H-hydrate epimerase [Longimicrobiales bacterium]
MRSVYGQEEIFALTADQAVAWDRVAREQHGISERLLMENAGRAVAAVVNKLFPRGRILALVGSGHNGGDALIAARILHTGDRDVAWLPASARVPALDVLEGVDVPRIGANDEEALRTADIIIDGVLGTGARGAPRDSVAAIIRAANAQTHATVAVDLPSGVDASTGAVPGDAIRARATVTFGAAKVGLLLHPARAHCGRLIVAEIGFPPLTDQPVAQLITPEWAWRRLPRRAPNAHKGSSGRVLLLVGSCGMAGAAVIAGRAAVRSGAGLVRIASAAENRLILQSTVPEATFFDRDQDLPFDGVHALVAGCGLGTDRTARSALERALAASEGLP